MTASLPQEVRAAFERFVTCEFTTIDARQQPITWPVTPYYSPGAASIDTTTGLGYPKKADDARRNPQVAMLFSDPTGSGVETGIQVLVQGTAEVDDRDLRANNERYRRESAAKLGGASWVRIPSFLHAAVAWYANRIYVKVRPERVFAWPHGDLATPPDCHGAHVEEVRSGHSEEPLRPHEPPAGGVVVWDRRIEELGRRHPTAVLTWVAPDGFPLSVRVPVSLDTSARKISIGAEPAGLPLTEGRVCLAAHAHSPDFNWRENFQVRGDLVRSADGGWDLVPHRLVGGLELPDAGPLGRYRSSIRRSLRLQRRALRELRERRDRMRG